MAETTVFIKDAGACLATTNVMQEKAPIRWLHRRDAQDPVDNGWRILSAIDETAYLNNEDNWQIVDFNEVCEIEPALIAIWNFPVGTELTVVKDDDGKTLLIDDKTGEPLSDEQLYGE